MSFISQLADLKGGATLENLQKLVEQEIDNRKYGKFLIRVSWIISEILVGPPNNQVFKSQQKVIYDACMVQANECFVIKNVASMAKYGFSAAQLLELTALL